MLDPSAMVPLTMVPIVISLLNGLGARRMGTRQSSLGRRRSDRDTERDCCDSSGNKEGIGHRAPMSSRRLFEIARRSSALTLACHEPRKAAGLQQNSRVSGTPRAIAQTASPEALVG
jgi:hypothetical protein